MERVLALPTLTVTEVIENGRPELKEVQVKYSTKKEFEKMAKQVKLMSDIRVSVNSVTCAISLIPHTFPTPPTSSSPSTSQGGVPRTAYKGIVSFMYKTRRVHFTPPTPWPGYEHLT